MANDEPNTLDKDGNEMLVVTVTIVGGVIQDVELPPGVCVVVHDYAEDGDDEYETGIWKED